MGGPQVAAAGVELVQPCGEIAVMGFAEVARALPQIRKARRTIREFLDRNPADLVVPLDFPGFNAWVAGLARARGIPVFWLIAPQVWAWGSWRTAGLRRRIDRLGTILPFEPAYFAARGFDVFAMGHPLLEDYTGAYPFLEALGRREKTLADRQRTLTVGLFPGSRRQELDHILPILKVAAQAVSSHLGPRGVRFLTSVAPGIEPSRISSVLEGRMEVVEEPVPGLLARCDLALVCSGTVSLEAALAGVPHEILYRTGALNYFFAKRLVRTQYIGLSNLILDRPVVREHIQDMASPLPLARSLLRWVARPAERQAFYADVRRIRELCGPPNVWPRTAAALLAFLDGSRPAGARERRA